MTRSIGFQKIVLVILASVLLTPVTTWAQTNSEYSFRQQAVGVDSSYGSNSDPYPALTINCLAANGYGQWTLTSTAGNNATMFPAGWYLLANGIYKPSTHYSSSDTIHHPGCIPPGVVQCGSLTYPTEVKATANLEGMAGFISPQQTGAKARQYFNESGFTATDFNLSFSFLSNPTSSRNVITSAIHDWDSISTVSGGHNHAVVSEIHWRDNFDWCSDGVYIYIAWASDSNSFIPGQEEIWVTIVAIGSGTPVIGFPKMVDDGTNHDGKYPTITCDPRNNRTGTPSPAFDVAYIQPSSNTIKYAIWSGAGWTTAPTALSKFFWSPAVGTPGSALPWYNPCHVRIVRNSVYQEGFPPISTVVIYAIVNRDVLADSASGVSLIYYAYGNLSGNANYVAGNLMAPPSPFPATRFLPIIDSPIVALADPYDNQAGWKTYEEFHCLYQYDLGIDSVTHEFPLCIVRASDVHALWPISPDPSNPDTRLVLNRPGGRIENDPINNWYVAAINQMGIHVHWIALNGFPSLPTHFYWRDTSRTFDEDIDENTLVTDICTVSDGSPTGTDHGGTVGATILQNKTVAVWTDPNYAFSLTNPDSGLYQPRTYGTPTTGVLLDPHVGQLHFIKENVVLNVGGASEVVADTSVPGNLTDMPYFYFIFFGADAGHTQGVAVHGTWNYYGLVAVHDPTTDTASLVATPFTDGSLILDFDPPYSSYFPTETGAGNIWVSTYTNALEDDTPATLIVHGGADFFCAKWTYFYDIPDANNMSGNIDVRYDGDVFPINNTHRHITDTTGHLTLDGKVLLERHTASTSFSNWAANWASGGNMQGHIPGLCNKEVILSVGTVWTPGTQPGASDSLIQFDDSLFNFFNGNDNSTSEIRMGYYSGSGLVYYPATDLGGDILFNGGLADGIQLHFVDPNFSFFTPLTYTVENMAFNNIRGQAIFFENDGDPIASNYGTVLINGNNFQGLPTNINSCVFGVYIKNFDGPLTGTTIDSFFSGTITISSNIFPDTNNIFSFAPGLNCPSSAIALENSTAFVLANTIKDKGYNVGITNWATPYKLDPFPDRTHSLICSNFISGLILHYVSPTFEYGIYSSYYFGYFKLNTITNCDDGYLTYGNDNPKFALDSLIGNHYNTLIVQDNSIVDMSGVHSTDSGTSDVAGFNTISGPTEPNPGLTDISLISIQNDGVSNIFLSNSSELWHWKQFGKNNIFVSPRDTIESQPIIQSFGGNIQIKSIDSNYFGGRNPASGSGFTAGCSVSPCIDGCGADPAKWNSSDTNEIDAVNIQYCATPSATITSGIIHRGTFRCDSATEYVAHKDTSAKPMSALSPDSLSQEECEMLYNWGYQLNNNGDWLASYDSLKKFIDECPNDPEAPSAFNFMSGDESELVHSDTAIWSDYQLWLRSVLYLDTTNPAYFCQIVEQMSPLIYYQSPGNDSVGVLQMDTALSVLYWLIQNTTCDTAFLRHQYGADRIAQYQLWQESGEGALDTTLPPLPPSLDSLLERHFLYAGVSEPPQPGILSNATAYPNPVSEGTVISFSIASEAYVRINLFDILGHQISSSGFESLVEPGDKSVPLSLQGLPSGTYYARIMTAYGEVLTVKLVKE